jgi:hypothetical protein
MTLVSALFRQFDIAGCGCDRGHHWKRLEWHLLLALFRHFDIAGCGCDRGHHWKWLEWHLFLFFSDILTLQDVDVIDDIIEND